MKWKKIINICSQYIIFLTYENTGDRELSHSKSTHAIKFLKCLLEMSVYSKNILPVLLSCLEKLNAVLLVLVFLKGSFELILNPDFRSDRTTQTFALQIF